MCYYYILFVSCKKKTFGCVSCSKSVGLFGPLSDPLIAIKTCVRQKAWKQPCLLKVKKGLCLRFVNKCGFG